LAVVHFVFTTGVIHGGVLVADSGGVRPVISLRSDVTITIGDGSLANPYRVQ